MKKEVFVLLVLLIWGVGSAQNLELRSGKDIKQPGKINPALAGVQGDLFKILSDAEVGKSYQLMLEGKIPLKLGNYMVGYERVFNENVANNMFNITYGRSNKKDKNRKNLNWRYGATVQIHNKAFIAAGFDSTAGYQFTDINGQVQSVPKLEDIETSLDYFNVELGGSLNYKNLIVGISIENMLQQNVSLAIGNERKIPFTSNLVIGGFVNISDNITLFPAAIAVLAGKDFYTKASIDLSSKKVNFTAAYTAENELQDISAAIGFRVKEKTLFGLRYAHPLSQGGSGLVNIIPSFNIFLNSTVFKSTNLFKSDLAKQMKKFY